MIAVILAAGRGKRMKHLTDDVPKPMLQLGGKPILEYILLGIKTAGIERVCIVTRYKSHVIKEYFGNGKHLGLQIEYAEQDERPGTGAAALAAQDIVGLGNFLLAYGDVLVAPKVYKLVRERFELEHPAGVLSVKSGEDVRQGGLVWFDSVFKVLGLIEKPSNEDLEQLILRGHIPKEGPFWYNAGIYAFSAVLFNYLGKIGLSPRGEYELTDAIKLMIRDGLQLLAQPVEGEWVDIRDPEILARINARLKGCS